MTIRDHYFNSWVKQEICGQLPLLETPLLSLYFRQEKKGQAWVFTGITDYIRVGAVKNPNKQQHYTCIVIWCPSFSLCWHTRLVTVVFVYYNYCTCMYVNS